MLGVVTVGCDAVMLSFVTFGLVFLNVNDLTEIFDNGAKRTIGFQLWIID
jgi:hypothetical protein